MKTKRLKGESNMGFHRGIHESLGRLRVSSLLWSGYKIFPSWVKSFKIYGDFTFSDGSSGLAHLLIRSS